LSEQRKQLEAVAAAQAAKETALHEREEAMKAAEAQRKRARNRNIALLAVSIFALFAGAASCSVLLIAKQADEGRTIIVHQRMIIENILTRATNIIANLQNQMDIDTQKEAFAIYEAGATIGDTVSMRHLGLAYQDGFGVARDYAKAREWYTKAADKGNVDAMFSLGVLYANGVGVAQDYAKAREWYEKAAGKGNASAKTALEQLPSR
jgi:TPR repeat protein